MYESQYYSLGFYPTVNHLEFSRRAARAFEQQSAVRELQRKRKAQRRQGRQERHRQEIYTTAV